MSREPFIVKPSRKGSLVAATFKLMEKEARAAKKAAKAKPAEVEPPPVKRGAPKKGKRA